MKRFKIRYISFLKLLIIKDIKKEFKFKSYFWSDGNITVKYKRVETLVWFDLGYNGNVYSIESLKETLNYLTKYEE